MEKTQSVVEKEVRMVGWNNCKLSKWDHEEHINRKKEIVKRGLLFEELVYKHFGHLLVRAIIEPEWCDLNIYPINEEEDSNNKFDIKSANDFIHIAVNMIKEFEGDSFKEDDITIIQPKDGFNDSTGRFTCSISNWRININIRNFDSPCRMEKYETTVERFRIVENSC